MKIDSVILENKEYFVAEKIEINNKLYYLLINENDNTDFCIRKRSIEEGIEYLVGLDNEKEFDLVMQTYLDKKKEIKSENIFPIGTIVKLNNYVQKVMLLGYLVKTKSGKIYDYCGCNYPVGILNKTDYVYFDKKDITQIIKVGYMDNEAKEVLSKIELSKRAQRLQNIDN